MSNLKTLRKTLLLATTMAIATHSFAQYNKTYPATINGTYTQTSRRGKVVDATNGDVTILINDHVNFNKIMLRKLDFNGNLIWQKTYQSQPGSDIEPIDMIRTPNGEYIVAGYHFMGGSVNVPFLSRFDANGNLVWINFYAGLAATLPWPKNGYADLDICHADDVPGSDLYMLVASGQPSYAPTTSFKNDVAIHVMRFAGNGSIVWSNKYNLPPATRSGITAPFYRDNPATIVYGKANDLEKYYIAGNSENVGGFDMTIDPSGNIINSYRNYTLTRNVSEHDAIFDQSLGRFVYSFAILHNTMAPAPVIGQLAVMSVPITTMAMHYELYYVPTVETHFAKSIREDATNSAYIIATDLDGDHNLPGYSYNMGILKINKTFVPQFLKRYNKFTGSGAASILSHSSLGTERYVLLGDRVSSAGNYDMRVVSANVTGSACGEESLSISQMNGNLTTTNQTYLISPYGVSKSPLGVDQLIDQINPDDCANAVDPNYYRPTSVNSIADNGSDLQVYPTMLNSDNNTINVTWHTHQPAQLTVAVYSMDGKKLMVKDLSAVSGDNIFTLDVPFNVPGNYVLSVYSSDKSISKTIRITKN